VRALAREGRHKRSAAGSWRALKTDGTRRIVIVISELLERQSKAKRRAPAYLRALLVVVRFRWVFLCIFSRAFL